MTILTSVTEFEDRIVDTIREIQRPVVDYVRKGVEQAEGRLPKLSYPKTLPKPGEVVETQFGFAKALLDTQRTFVSELVDAVAPLVEDEKAPKAAVRTPVTPVTPVTTAAAPKTTRSKAKTTKAAAPKTAKD
jgi:hypothetical protein